MSAPTRDFRGVARPVGVVVLGLAVAMLLCAGVGFAWTQESHGVLELLLSAAAVGAMGATLFRYGGRYAFDRVTRREAVLAVSCIWFAAGVFGALPFMLGGHMSFDDAVFEAVSGLTTTGATVITDIQGTLSKPLLLWRALIQWLGGMGIVVLFVAIFPNLGAGGKHMFRGEVPGAIAEGLTPRVAETAFTLWKLYAALTVLETLLLYFFSDMDGLFEALCHALTTMSTGGFSTRDGSIGEFDATTQSIISLFMLVGSVNYGLYYAALRGRNWRIIFRSIEFQAFLIIVASSVLLLGLFNLEHHETITSSFHYALFLVATTISSTGYGASDYTVYGAPSIAIMVTLMFIGGCSGSTAGGLKVERIVLLSKHAAAQVRRSFRPAVVQVVRMGRMVIDKSVLADVTAMFAIFMACMSVGVMVITTVDGVPAPTAFGAMLTCLSNMGPAPFHELGNLPDNFASYSGFSKLFFSLAMLLGRLEFFTLFALVIPDFWRR